MAAVMFHHDAPCMVYMLCWQWKYFHFSNEPLLRYERIQQNFFNTAIKSINNISSFDEVCNRYVDGFHSMQTKKKTCLGHGCKVAPSGGIIEKLSRKIQTNALQLLRRYQDIKINKSLNIFSLERLLHCLSTGVHR